MLTVAIHQPNFMPWYPFFQKMREAEVFILLSRVQFVKGNYHNRFGIGKNWYTMSVNKHPSFQSIEDKKYINWKEDWETIKRRLPKYEGLLSLFDDCISESMEQTNKAIIYKITELLNIPTIVVPEVSFPNETGPARLLRICKSVQADCYLGGPSTVKYFTKEDAVLFQKNGVRIQVMLSDQQEKKSILEKLHEVI